MTCFSALKSCSKLANHYSFGKNTIPIGKFLVLVFSKCVAFEKVWKLAWLELVTCYMTRYDQMGLIEWFLGLRDLRAVAALGVLGLEFWF